MQKVCTGNAGEPRFPNIFSFRIFGLRKNLAFGEDQRCFVQGGCGCPIPEGVQGQVSQGLEQPGRVKDVPAHGRTLELDGLKGPLQPKLFWDSLIRPLFFIVWLVGFFSLLVFINKSF